LILVSSIQIVQSQVPDVSFVVAYELNWSAVDQTPDDEIWVSIHKSNGTVINIQVTDTGAGESDPSIAIASNGNIIIAWEQVIDEGQVDVYYAVLNSEGGIIKGPTLISSGTNDRDPSVAVTPNNVVFLIWESSPGDDVVYVTMNIKGGNVSSETRISGINGDIDDPTVAASTKNMNDNRVIIAWEDSSEQDDSSTDEVAYTILDSKGNVLITKRVVTTTTKANAEINAAILPNGNAVMAWEGDGDAPNDDVGYVVINKLGIIVVPVTFLERPDDVDAVGVAATPEGNIIIVWDEEQDGIPDNSDPDEIMYVVLRGNGNTLKSTSQLTFSTKDEDEPDVAVDKHGNVIIPYEQPLSPDERIDFAVLDSNGLALGTNNLTDGTHDVDLDGDDGRRQVATLPGGISPVGGITTPVNKLVLLLPYITIAGLIIGTTVFINKKRKH
jgi:hypothetical protein